MGSSIQHPALSQVSFEHCLMSRFGQCALALEGDQVDKSCTEGIEWIACGKCEGWYHSVCVGVCKSFVTYKTFYCMCTPSLNTSDM